MRIVVHGQQAFGRAVLERLLEQGENVVAVCVAPDKEGRPVDPLKELALEHSLPVHQPASWKTDESLELMKSFDADVCMMAYVLLFVPDSGCRDQCAQAGIIPVSPVAAADASGTVFHQLAHRHGFDPHGTEHFLAQ